MLYEKYIRLNIPVIIEAPTPSGPMCGDDNSSDEHGSERRANLDDNNKEDKKKKKGECNILTRWNKEGLLRYHSGVKVHVATRPLPSLPIDGSHPFASDPEVDTMSIREFIESVMLAQKDSKQHAHGAGGSSSNPNLQKNATNPEQRYVFNTMNILIDDLAGCDILELLDDAVEAGARQQQQQGPTSEQEPPSSLFVTSHNTVSGEYEGHFEFSMGPALTGAHMHQHTTAFNLVATGRKRWALSPYNLDKEATEQGQETKALDWFLNILPELQTELGGGLCRLLEFEQGPGELVFVPDQYYHAVLNLEPGVAASKQFGRLVWPKGLPDEVFTNAGDFAAPQQQPPHRHEDPHQHQQHPLRKRMPEKEHADAIRELRVKYSSLLSEADALGVSLQPGPLSSPDEKIEKKKKKKKKKKKAKAAKKKNE